MAALIKQFFKSRRNKGDSAGAVIERLDPTRDSDLRALKHLATDADSNEERQAAIARLPDPAMLIDVYRQAPANLRGVITQRINDLASRDRQSVLDTERKLDHPEERDLLRQLLASGEEGPESIVAEADSAELRRYATEGQTAALRRAATERVESESDLQAIQKAAKGRDKGVYQLAKRKLQALRSEQERQARTQATIDELIRQAKAHADTQDTTLYGPQLEKLRQEWQNCREQASVDQETRFLNALDACYQRQKSLEEEARQGQEAEGKKAERNATLQLLRETMDELQSSDPNQAASLSSLDALQKTQENRWLEATRDTEVDRAEQKDYQSLMLGLRGYIAARQRLDQSEPTLRELTEAETPDSDQLRQQLTTIDWPSDFPEPSLLHQARERLGEARLARQAAASDQKAQQRALDDALEQLERALEDNLLRESRQLHRKAKQLFDSLDHHHGASRQARLTRLGRQVQELRDWQGFATRPKQEELCDAMEYLAEQHMEPEAKATRIQELQQEWRALGGSSNQALWHRFKEAADRAFAPCQDYFAAKSELKMTNVRTREAICDQLATFIDEADWDQVDWKSVERIHRVARQEWRDAWPVDFRANRPVQKRFDRLLKTIGKPLDEERARNEAAKADIVSRAEALIEHEPLGDAMAGAKALQREWEQIGITRHREDRRLWKAFRAACDAIFARREEAKAEQASRDRDAINTLETLLAESRQTRNNDPEESALRDLAKRLRSATVPKSTPSMLRSEVDAEREMVQRQLDKSHRSGLIARWKREIQEGTRDEQSPDVALPDPIPEPTIIAVRLEIATGAPSPEHDQNIRMAQQVERLAAGMSGSSEQTNEEQELERLIACWCAADETPATELQQRLMAALDYWAT
ncbi:DUF349 domain-containing protein [Tamilnaduibacter salinus]|nr:DUF349 domain-containing protein [Tamilnaduibacter salinus]